jgi:hypothetical protein
MSTKLLHMSAKAKMNAKAKAVARPVTAVVKARTPVKVMAAASLLLNPMRSPLVKANPLARAALRSPLVKANPPARAALRSPLVKASPPARAELRSPLVRASPPVRAAKPSNFNLVATEADSLLAASIFF